MLTAKESRLLDVLAPHAESQNLEIVTVEIVGSKKAPTIRIYIDKDGGIGFDDLSGAQGWINDIMDELDPFPGAYVLEVSSPGIDRPLRTPEHFKRFEGQTAVVKAKEPIDGRSSFTGTIVSADEEQVELECEDGVHGIPYDMMKKARLKGEVEFR